MYIDKFFRVRELSHHRSSSIKESLNAFMILLLPSKDLPWGFPWGLVVSSADSESLIGGPSGTKLGNPKFLPLETGGGSGSESTSVSD